MPDVVAVTTIVDTVVASTSGRQAGSVGQGKHRIWSQLIPALCDTDYDLAVKQPSAIAP